MSAGGRGDQIGESKAVECEISSTTPDNGGLIPSVSHTNNSEAISVADISTTEPLEPAKTDAASAILTTEFVDDGKSSDKPGKDLDEASSSAKLVEDDDCETKSIVEAKVGSDLINSNIPDVVADEDNITSQANEGIITSQESNIVKNLNLDIEPELAEKEINESILADADKDCSSLGDEIELRWEDDEESHETIPTTDVLKQLDQELANIDASDKSQEANNEMDGKSEFQQEITDKNITESKNLELKESSTTMQVKSSDDDVNQDVQMPSGNDDVKHTDEEISSTIHENLKAIDEHSKLHGSDDLEMAESTLLEESQKIIDQIDNLTKVFEDVEMENVKDISSTETVGNPLVNQIDSLVKENPNMDIDMEKDSIKTEILNESQTTETEIVDESLTTETEKVDESLTTTNDAEIKLESVEEMDVDTLPDETSKSTSIPENTLAVKSLVHKKVNVHSEVLDKEDNTKKIYTTDDSETNEAVIDKIGESQESITPPDVPSVSLPIEITNVSDNVKTLKAIEIDPKTEPLEVTKTECRESDCKNKLDIQNVKNTSHLEKEGSVTGLLFHSITPNIHHRINKPNVMLDIPTQELSDIEAELEDDSELYDEENTSENIKVENERKSPDDDIDMKDIDAKILTGAHNITSSKVITSPAIEIDATSSVLNITTVSPMKFETSKAIPSTSKSLQYNVLNATSKLEVIDGTATSVQDDVKPSTSKQVVTEKLIPDNTDSVQEVTDSLGLLAESSRVVDDENDDDDDAEELDPDDNDDDEDFDPYEESNSAISEDMDDSNTPPPELEAKMTKTGTSKGSEERESDEGTMDVPEGTIDIVDDIECEENELLGMELPDDAASETPSNEDNAVKEGPEIIDADTHENTNTISCPDKVIDVLDKVQGDHSMDGSWNVNHIRSFVDLECSTDSDVTSAPLMGQINGANVTAGIIIEEEQNGDLQELKLNASKVSDIISVNVPDGVQVTSTSGTSEITNKKGKVITSDVAEPPPQKMSKKPAGFKEEIFSLDSDEEDTETKETSAKIEENVEMNAPSKADSKCINPECTSVTETYFQADRATAKYYSLTGRTAVVCERCRERASERRESLLNGIRDLRPLLELDMAAPSQQLVEISDSDSEGENDDDTPRVGERGAMFLEENLADMINETWVKYKFESRLKDTEMYLLDELEKIDADAKEIDAVLDECQKKTDAIRVDFYKDYELRRKSMGGLIIYDTPFSSYSHTEKDIEEMGQQTTGSRYPKRRAASTPDTPAKRPAIPLGYGPLEGDSTVTQSDVSGNQIKDDDKEDISVVKLSAESAPADLPPCGEIVRPPLKTGMTIYAMRNAFGTWLKGRIMDVQLKLAGQQFTQCRVKFDHKVKNPCKVLAARCLAYPEPCAVRMIIGTRVVALFKDPHNTTRRDSFYSGVIAEIPNPVNNYRYLVFFDDGYAQYVHHQDTRIVCESSSLVWEEVHPFIRDFICNYLLSYPERPMVRLHAGEKLKTEWNGKWWASKVLKVDASIALIHFDEDNRTEWIYRGSTRLAPLYLELQAAEKAGEGRARSRMPRSKAQMRSNMPYVEYTRSDEQASETQAIQQYSEDMRQHRAVAKKSTTTAVPPPLVVPDLPLNNISRVVYYTPKNAVKPLKLSPHACSAKCRRGELLSLKELRTYNPLAKPLLSGWERQTVRYKGQRGVMYRAPCGRRLRNMPELHRYLRLLQSDLSVDLFDFTPGIHCLAEFVLHKSIVSKKDLSHGKENVPVPCVNYYDEALPEFCSYNTERTPTSGVPLNLDPEFLCGCDCTDDCMDKTACACWKMTLEGARTIGLVGSNVGYVYRRLPEPLPSGIYECNSRCKCKQTCLNRVAQQPLQLKLQVFKTINRGWGIRALNDVPKGAFLCVYAGNLLTDATANLDGLNEGDEYLAELDYIEVVEGMKEGYEDDVADDAKKLDKKRNSSASETEPSESEEERDKAEKDGDFRPAYTPSTNMEFKKSLRKREKAKQKEEQEKQNKAVKKDDYITISDDEEVREPSRFTAQAGMVDKGLVSKQSSRVSVRTLFGKEEACYIMDAKVQGNIGRYLNHSCHPNVFVQNVFVDTHDPRFPWVAFFALSAVRAGTELTWNYNYDVGSVPEKVLYCYCGATNCRGRLL